MRKVTVKIEGRAPYSASRNHSTPLLNEKERPEDYDDRTWRNKIYTKDGNVVIPPMAFKFSLDRASKISGRQIPGKGKATYSKFFDSGVIVTDFVPIAPESAIECERVFVHSNGVRGAGKRVWRNFPRVDVWSGEVTYYIIADEIPKDVFEDAVRSAGVLVGLGRFRPENSGYFGRYEVTGFSWE